MINYLDDVSSCTKDIYELEKMCFTDSWSYDSVKKDIENANSLWIAAYDDNSLIGYVCAMHVFDEAEINRIVVKNEYRNMGIGNTLLRMMLTKLSEFSCQKVFLEVRATNLNAISLYKKNGFHSVGIRKGYYMAPVEDALIMSKEIN